MREILKEKTFDDYIKIPLEKYYQEGFFRDPQRSILNDSGSFYIEIDEESAYNGLTNSVRVNQYILNASNLNELKSGTDDYLAELKKNQLLERICVKNALQPVHFNLSEYIKSGAMLSCMIMHLNRASYLVRIS